MSITQDPHNDPNFNLDMSCDRVCARVHITCINDYVISWTSVCPSFPHSTDLLIMADMDVDVDIPAAAPKKDDSKKRFEVKKVCSNLHGL
jgi:hypothetical protein